MKKAINYICLIITALYATTAIVVAVNVFSADQKIFQWFMEDRITDIRLYLNIPILYFLIYNIVIWYRNDRKPLNVILLIVLNIFFLPYYYLRSIKNGWA